MGEREEWERGREIERGREGRSGREEGWEGVGKDQESGGKYTTRVLYWKP